MYFSKYDIYRYLYLHRASLLSFEPNLPAGHGVHTDGTAKLLSLLLFSIFCPARNSNTAVQVTNRSSAHIFRAFMQLHKLNGAFASERIRHTGKLPLPGLPGNRLRLAVKRPWDKSA